jgi:hypothetical protein
MGTSAIQARCRCSRHADLQMHRMEQVVSRRLLEWISLRGHARTSVRILIAAAALRHYLAAIRTK